MVAVSESVKIDYDRLEYLENVDDIFLINKIVKIT